MGSLPSGILKWSAGGQQALATRARIQEVVQRNLRLILGAQFTRREGEMLLARAFDPNQQESENLYRLKLLREQITKAAQAKQEAGQYFDKHGTLVGWKGHELTFDDLPEALRGSTDETADASNAQAPPTFSSKEEADTFQFLMSP